MKRMYFRSLKSFLKELDGKVYAVCDVNGRYLCDVLEDDYLKLIDAGILVNIDDSRDYFQTEADSSVVIALDMGVKGYDNFKERFGLLIEIEEEKHATQSHENSIEYEIDSLILKSSVDESETAFIFMNGLAVQIESVDSCIPLQNPIILTYPRKCAVFNNVRMRDEIEAYRGQPWEGDYYSIALLYGKEMRLYDYYDAHQ